jgi:hypothetical protein
MKIGPYLLDDIGNEGEKWFISPYYPDNSSHPIKTKFGKIGDMDKVIKHAKYGVDQLIRARSVGS